MPELITPRDREIDQAVRRLRDPGPDTQYLLAALNNMTNLLNTIAGQLDMLIRLEAEVLAKDDVQAKYMMFDAQKEAALADNDPALD